jgi:hypothetical protein
LDQWESYDLALTKLTRTARPGFVEYFSDNSDLGLVFPTAPTEGNAVTSKIVSALYRYIYSITVKAALAANRLIPMSEAQGLAPRFSVSVSGQVIYTILRSRRSRGGFKRAEIKSRN